MAGWATAPMDRTQIRLFCPNLDEMLSQDHPARLFDEILRQLDWSGWECQYVLVAGQPPIHPRVVAGVLLYGLSAGMRSSRRLEWACGHAVDFMWLAEGRPIDHATFCDFRTRFSRELKALFGQVGRVAMDMGMIRLNHVALDGTKVKANSSRHATAGVQTIQERLAELDAQVEKLLGEAHGTDQREAELFGDSVSPAHLPRELADVKRRQARLRQALARAHAEQAARDQAGQPKPAGLCDPAGRAAPPEKAPKDVPVEAKAKPVKVPVADPQAPISPNKEGGYAPNFLPMAAVDGESGMIVANDVLSDNDESAGLIPLVDQVKETFGQHPAAALADSGFNSGPNLEALEARQVAGYIPSGTRQDRPDNPARRAQLDQPVPAQHWDRLPIDTSTKRLGRAAFIYDAAGDCYHCPMGQRLEFEGLRRKPRRKEVIDYHRYRCGHCRGCPLGGRCLPPDSLGKIIDRDVHEPLREARDERLRSPEGRRLNRQRCPLVEGALGVLKSVLGVRQFLLRGLAKVRTEWCWAAIAYNLKKMTLQLGRLRAQVPAVQT